MTAYILESEKYDRIVVGWDSPLETFFIQVWTHLDEENPVYWRGTVKGDIRTISDLVILLRPYATLNEEMMTKLETDRQENPSRTSRTVELENLLALTDAKARLERDRH